ncbi:MAG TPA: hypothetical protein VGM06_20135 [Polyangiaceae bacterium]
MNDPTSDDASETEAPVVLERIARESAPVLDNLVELYAHDFSEFIPLAIKESGRFELSFGDAWWWRDDRFPFFIRQGSALAGFALVERGSRVTSSSDMMSVAEFFVVRGARRHRVGTRAAHAVFGLFPGPWEVRVRKANVVAMAFWARALEEWPHETLRGGAFSAEGVDWNVFHVEP